MEKVDNKRAIITFDCGSRALKEKAIKLAKEFSPVKVSLSSICLIALREYVEKNIGKTTG